MTATFRLIATLLALFVSGTAHAQNDPANYPARPVRLIVAYPPGGPTDLIARLVAQKLSDHFKQQFYVENLPGAGGAIGAGIAANAPPDGHTLFVTTNDFAVGATTSKLRLRPGEELRANQHRLIVAASGDCPTFVARQDHARAGRAGQGRTWQA